MTDGASRRTGGGPEPLPDLRQRTVDVLCEAFADDRMTVEEFERRVERAHAAGSEEELRRLLSDLPGAGTVLDRPESGSGGTAMAPSAPTTAGEDRTYTLPPMARPDEVAAHAFVAGVLGGGGRAGRWVPARTNWAVGLMGGVDLDLRDAVFPPGVTEVRALAVWGGVDVMVPPGVRVEVSGLGLLGGFQHDQTVPSTDNPDAPVVRVTGVACMGGVDVSVRYPGESAREARRRLKQERRERRRLVRGEGRGPPEGERG